jgi:hypothetical protein
MDLTRHVAAEIMRIREVAPELAIWIVRPLERSFSPGQYVAMGVCP